NTIDRNALAVVGAETGVESPSASCEGRGAGCQGYRIGAVRDRGCLTVRGRPRESARGGRGGVRPAAVEVIVRKDGRLGIEATAQARRVRDMVARSEGDVIARSPGRFCC